MELRASLAFALLAFMLLPCAHALVYSTLELSAESDSGAPVEGAHFFLECKMNFATAERHVCTSNLSGSCKSACMDCAEGEPASIRAQYGEQEAIFEISSWAGEESCKAFYAPLNVADAFVFEVEEEIVPVPETGGEGAQESIPENTNIETKDYNLGELGGEDYEYTSYLEETQGEDGDSADGACLPAFALPALFLIYYSKYSGNRF